MPRYPTVHMNEFKRLLKAANPTVESGLGAKVFGKSSLQPLVAILEDDQGNAQKVSDAIDDVAGVNDGTYGNKANKYKEALYYLQRSYPVPIASRVGVRPTKAKAVRLSKGGTQPKVANWTKHEGDNARSWVPAKDDGMTLAAASRIETLTGTVEEFLLSDPVDTGVLMIHLQGFQEAMNRVYDGWKALDHMKSVLRVAAGMRLPLCMLRVSPGESVCPELCPPRDLFGDTIQPYVKRHSGFHDDSFREFVTARKNLVVMGFDADVCVHINMFGGPELMDATEDEKRNNKPARAVGALLAEVNVITSRPLLVARGMSVIDRDEFGPYLHHT